METKPKATQEGTAWRSTGSGSFSAACRTRLLLLVLLVFPGVVQAQFAHTANNGTITIVGYTGPGGAVVIPSTINGLPVTGIGGYAFAGHDNLTNVTIPIGITNIAIRAFGFCTSLRTITVDAPNSFFSSVDGVLFNKSQTLLIRFPAGKGGSYTIPKSVTWTESAAFANCTGLHNVTVPDGVIYIGDSAFSSCTSLTGAYFQSYAPLNGGSLFEGATNATVYYLPGITGWGETFGGRPTAPWLLPSPLILNSGLRFGIQLDVFSFIISWATNATVVVEAAASLVNPAWIPVGTNVLTSGSSYFSDPQWTNHPARFYRLRSP